ncbi:hypothetical protein C9J12_27025 [Photobacterium frigidiphilum]|uniref:KfrA N-terminal DNA-binding domain-containing protein n=2 Tax=Photobacterium frigidiphilum TaxID=264736 RepID=A0A2T3J708_9GAMM|nr:hypothetical protein C9J12_27025 [Photobacterium frigidiphilum]
MFTVMLFFYTMKTVDWVVLTKGILMVAAKVKEEKVFELANRIVGQGEWPTVLKLHKTLGEGSYTTIQKYLKNWEQSEAGMLAKEAALPDELVLPASASDAMQVALKTIWTAAQQAATERIDQSIAESQAEIEAQELLAQEVLTKAETTELRLIDAEKRILHLESERETHIDERATLRQQLSSSELELTREQQKAHDATEQHGKEITQVNTVLSETKKVLEALQVEYADKQNVLTAEVAKHDESKQSLASTTAQLEAANDKLSELVKQLDGTKTELSTSQTQLIAELSRHDETKQSLAGANAELKASERLLTNIESQLLEQKQANNTLSESITLVRNELTDSKVSESVLRGELSKVDALSDENKALRQALDGNIAKYIEKLGNEKIN